VNAVQAIAGVTLRQALRDRVLHVMLGCAVAAILASWAVGWVTPTDPGRVIIDFTLATLSVLSVLVAVVLGGRLLRDDIERRTLHTICAKDVSRGAVILGKYLGLLAAFAASLAAAAAVAATWTLLLGGHVGWGYATAVRARFGELAVLVGASLFFSTVASAVVSAGATLAVWAIGHSLDILPWFASAWGEGALKTMAEWLPVLLPNFTLLDFHADATHARIPALGDLALAATATVAWSAVFLAGAWGVFRSKEL
jgi:ABC-type transport system involved in multi-copper enzyme maturation permease subunit